MYSLILDKNIKKLPKHRERKFNAMLIYFLCNTVPGVVIYKGNNKINIQKLFTDHIFLCNKPIKEIWEYLSADNIYLITDQFDIELYEFIKPIKMMCKISAGQTFDFKYDVVYPPRSSGKKFYCVTNTAGSQESYTTVDLEIFNKMRGQKHTLGFPGLKKRCRCWDCWAELEIFKIYISGINCNFKIRSKHYRIITMIKIFKEKFPLEKDFCI